MNDQKNDKTTGTKPDDKHQTPEKGHGNQGAGLPKGGAQGEKNVKDQIDPKSQKDQKGQMDPKGQKDQMDPKGQKDEKRSDRR